MRDASRRGPADFATALVRRQSDGGDDAAGHAAAASESIFCNFVPTPPEQHARLVELGGIRSTDIVCDLGFGDGSLLLGIAKLTGCTACGCEIDADLVKTARETIISSGIGPQRIVLTESGIAQFILSPQFEAATVIICFLTPAHLEALVPNFKSALSAGVRILTQKYPIPGMGHLRNVDGGSRLQGAEGRPDAFAWISEVAEELKGTRRDDELSFPVQGEAFLYSCGP